MAIHGRRGSVIEIVPYRDSWSVEFRAIGRRLRDSFDDLALRIDHIGSTSVPGLAAKDVIDVQVTVAAFEPEEPLRLAAEAAGLSWWPEIAHDHVPHGSTGSWAKRYAREADGRRTNVHIRADGTPNQRYALLFRDYLRVHANAAGAYGRLKIDLAALVGDDRDAYTDTKDHACDLIMAAAEAWASSTGWRPGSADA